MSWTSFRPGICRRASRTYYHKGRANLLNGFAISRTYCTEYVRGSLRLFPMHWTMDMGREKYRTQVSDHLPFVATFRI